MADITQNSQHLTGKPRESIELNTIIDGINAMMQHDLIDASSDLAAQGSIITATGIWLDLLGKRLDFPRPYLDSTELEAFGFDDNGVGFDQAPFGKYLPS